MNVFQMRIRLGGSKLSITAKEGGEDRNGRVTLVVRVSLDGIVRGYLPVGIPAHQSLDGAATKRAVLSFLSTPSCFDGDDVLRQLAEEHGEAISLTMFDRYGE